MEMMAQQIAHWERVNEFVKKYPDKIKVFVMDREYDKKYDSVKRASANRLNLIKNMTGDLFCIIDGDDYFCDITFVEQAVKIFKKILIYRLLHLAINM